MVFRTRRQPSTFLFFTSFFGPINIEFYVKSIYTLLLNILNRKVSHYILNK